MVAAGVTKSSKKKVNNSSDIVANFHQSSSISKVELDSVFHECNRLLKDIKENKSEQSKTKLERLFDKVEM
jgi:hypothetical protein